MEQYKITLTKDQLMDVRYAIEDAHIIAEKSLKALTPDCPLQFRKGIEDRIKRFEDILAQILK